MFDIKSIKSIFFPGKNAGWFAAEKQQPSPTQVSRSCLTKLSLSLIVSGTTVVLNDASVPLSFMLHNLILSMQLKHLCPLFSINNKELIWVQHKAPGFIYLFFSDWRCQLQFAFAIVLEDSGLNWINL